VKTPELHDEEFGDIYVQRRPNAKYVRIRLDHRGQIHATLPTRGSLIHVRKLIESSRAQLRAAIEAQTHMSPPMYEDGMTIGHTHRIELVYADNARARTSGQTIVWAVPHGSLYTSAQNQEVVRRAVRKALNNQAAAYLPRRLVYIAQDMGVSYSSIRYANQKGRWGSCSTQGVISLNVALMNLPKELIDYVLVHELAHLTHMNHSPQFWQLVEQHYPDYKNAKKQLKDYSPYL